MTNILVTGSNGQLGSEIRDISGIYPEYKFTFVDIDELDLTNHEEVQIFFSENSFNFCINCAAYTAVDRAEEESEKAMIVNTDAVANLAKICANYHTFLIHISTDYVFNGKHYKPYVESDPTSANSVYGNTKLKGEKAVIQNTSQWLIIRSSWLYSSYGHNFVKTILRLGSERDALKVVDDQVGTPTFAGDLATAILKIVSQLIDKEHNGVYHFSNEGVASWFDFAVAITEDAKLGCKVVPIESKDFPSLAKRPNYSVLNKHKIKKDFGLVIPYWRDSLKVVLKQLSGNKNTEK